VINEKILNEITHIAFEAGKITLRYFQSPFETHNKVDGSPVTKADLLANNFIVDALTALTPSIPIVSEEGNNPDSISDKTFWCVDPLDGTKQFIKGRDEFTVNIGFIHKGSPLLGVILQPTSGLFVKAMPGIVQSGHFPNASTIPLTNSPKRLRKIIYLGTHHDENEQFHSFLKHNHLQDPTIAIVKSSLKFCYLTLGRGDYIFRSRPCYEWDTAAGHALIKAMGGNLFDLNSHKEVVYGEKEFIVPNFFACRSAQ
jgi:3'(2'), 5'-bisphosphate nucleotidase